MYRTEQVSVAIDGTTDVLANFDIPDRGAVAFFYPQAAGVRIITASGDAYATGVTVPTTGLPMQLPAPEPKVFMRATGAPVTVEVLVVGAQA